MTAELTDDCCCGWMGTFLFFVIIPFFLNFVSPVTKDKKPKNTHTHLSISGGTFPLSSRGTASFVVVVITGNGRKKNKKKGRVEIK